MSLWDNTDMDTGRSAPFDSGRCLPLDWEHLLTAEEATVRSLEQERQVFEYLLSDTFPKGLAQSMIFHTDSFAVRLWLINNAGSMNQPDAHQVVRTSATKVETVPCTRWEQISSSVGWQGNFCCLMKVPMVVQLVNDPGRSVGEQQVVMAAGSNDVMSMAPSSLAIEEQRRLRRLFKSHPGGNMPFTLHLKDILENLSQLDWLLLQDRLVVLILCVDRLPTDSEGREGLDVMNEFIDTLYELQRYPVHIVIRLCTDERRVVDVYGRLVANNRHSGGRSGLDTRSLSLTCLQDYVREAIQINNQNPWLNYGYPLHRCRESGVTFPEFEALSDHPLLPQELAVFVNLLLGLQIDSDAQQSLVNYDLPDPSNNYASFRRLIACNDTGKTWNPVVKTPRPWIDLRILDTIYATEKLGEPVAAAASCPCIVL